jgi:cytochrome c2
VAARGRGRVARGTGHRAREEPLCCGCLEGRAPARLLLGPRGAGTVGTRHGRSRSVATAGRAARLRGCLWDHAVPESSAPGTGGAAPLRLPGGSRACAAAARSTRCRNRQHRAREEPLCCGCLEGRAPARLLLGPRGAGTVGTRHGGSRSVAAAGRAARLRGCFWDHAVPVSSAPGTGDAAELRLPGGSRACAAAARSTRCRYRQHRGREMLPSCDCREGRAPARLLLGPRGAGIVGRRYGRSRSFATAWRAARLRGCFWVSGSDRCWSLLPGPRMHPQTRRRPASG